ncbi:retinoic acid early-inducible protein 1-beta-like [Apodemus sylvaticus]|uniref:retinoic acid early-inducible protein 1-beta-like n=1 Tax=Apodemus sylvaticus TaxID=10129 RepID=UPI0022432002|nr:retinoic acid early-inducible protein 1-beta-like [Apodemus sylvaticus]
MANATKVRSCLTEHLENLCQELRNKVEKSLGYPTLQATMLSQHSYGQLLSACWLFNINEKYFFTLDTVTMSWRPTNAVSGDIMNKWKGDKDLMKHLNFSIAEGSQKLNEFFKQHKEKPRSTPRSPDITQVTSPTQLPPTGHVPYKEVYITVGLIIFFIICIYQCVRRKCCTQGDRNLQLLRACCIDCHKPQRKDGPKETRGEVPNQTTKMLSQEEEPKACRSQRRASDPVELELRMVPVLGAEPRTFPRTASALYY